MEGNYDCIFIKPVVNTQLLRFKEEKKRERAGKKRVLTITLQQKAFYCLFHKPASNIYIAAVFLHLTD